MPAEGRPWPSDDDDDDDDDDERMHNIILEFVETLDDVGLV